MDKKAFGVWCEDTVASYLEAKGWSVLDKRVRFREGEIDLICEVDGELRFVEVKGRRSEKFGSVVEAVTSQKVRRLRKAISRWRGEKKDYRFGLIIFVACFVDGGGTIKIEEHLIE